MVNIIQAGTLDGGEVDLAAVKEIVMKDLEIFLDKEVFPAIDQRLNPAQEQPPAEPDAGDAGDADTGEEAAEEE